MIFCSSIYLLIKGCSTYKTATVLEENIEIKHVFSGRINNNLKGAVKNTFSKS